MERLKKMLLFMLPSFLVIFFSFFLINGFSPRDISAQASEPELILFLAGSSSTPFNDLSPYNHPVNNIPNELMEPVQIVYDPDLKRDVFSFANGGYLKIEDYLKLLKVTSEDKLTIEVNVKITDQDPLYCCGEQVLPITDPIPDQMIFCKGPLDFINGSYVRNYAVGFGWGRDDMRDECGLGNVGYFPGVGFGIGGTTHGFDSPMNTSDLVGWRVYSFLISKLSESETIVWCYTNRNDNPYPANFPINEIVSQANDYPLAIGNGFATCGTAEFQPNPFYGYIDYIRIYKGLLPIEELNDNPLNLPELPIPPNQPPVALCQDIEIIYGETITPEEIDGGSYDPDEGDNITLSVDNEGPFSLGEHYVNLTVTDGSGESDTCQASITVVNTPPGTGVVVEPEDPVYGSPVTLTFAAVTEGGGTTLNISETGAPPDTGFKLGIPPRYYEIETTAVYSGPITICIDYTGTSFAKEENIKLYHREVGGYWIEIPSTVNTEDNIICGEVFFLSIFAIFEPMALEDLIQMVQASSIAKGVQNSLVAKLQNAQKSLEKGNINAAINQIEAFQNEVLAQRGKKIPSDLADEWTEISEVIMDNI